MNRAPLIVIITVAVLAAGAFFWWRHEQPVPTIATPSSSPATPPPPPIVAPTPAATKPAIRYPVPAAPPPRPALPSLDQADAYVEKALIDLLGRKSVQSFLRLDEFARNFVATVNNLATDNAAAQLWPVKQASGHFDSESRNGATVISAKNAARYAAFIRFADSVDTRRAIALYLRLYPLFQRAYEELGYPGQYFNDRVVEVIDNLLATPNVAEPIKVKRITVDGSAPSAAAGLYVFEDPSLEASTAGQKILLRMGRENRAKLMAKLTSIRQAIVNSGLPSR
jgi:transglutaminase-like putative cysteine protease